MKKRLQIALAFLLGGFTAVSNAANDWYWGNVTKIITSTSDGSFIVYTTNTTVKNTCAHSRAYFNVADMGADRTQAALTLALTAYASGDEFGIVMDDQINAGDTCKAAASSGQGAGIRK